MLRSSPSTTSLLPAAPSHDNGSRSHCATKLRQSVLLLLAIVLIGWNLILTHRLVPSEIPKASAPLEKFGPSIEHISQCPFCDTAVSATEIVRDCPVCPTVPPCETPDVADPDVSTPTRESIELWQFNRHHRWVVQSMLYMHSLFESEATCRYMPGTCKAADGVTTPTIPADDKMENSKQPELCIGILSSKRPFPYLSMTLSSILRVESPEDLMKMIEIHIVDTSGGTDTFHELERIRESLPFINIVKASPIGQPPEELTNEYQEMTFKQLWNYRDALEVCRTSTAEWSLILEDDAYGAENVVEIIRQQVIQPLRGFEQNVSFVHLFESNLGEVPPEYHRHKPDDAINVDYKLSSEAHYYGNVAKLIPRENLQELCDFIDDKGRTKRWQPADVMVSSFFPSRRRAHDIPLTLRPSLFEHAGYFSTWDYERREGNVKFSDTSFVEHPRIHTLDVAVTPFQWPDGDIGRRCSWYLGPEGCPQEPYPQCCSRGDWCLKVGHEGCAEARDIPYNKGA